ncbi:MAG: thioredoxin family protein [Bdellovibrionales bacterium]|nr:thioredoxin family protein [Bdellovibrionales bacterium]
MNQRFLLFYFLLSLNSPFLQAKNSKSSSLDFSKKQSIKLASNPNKISQIFNKDSFFTIKLISPYTQVKKGEPFLIGVQIKMEEDWYSYWSFPGDFGIAPHLKIPNLKHIQLKRLPLPLPKRKAVFLEEKPYYSFIYSDEFFIPLEVFIQEDYHEDMLNLNLDLEWGICKDICLDKENSLQIKLKVGSEFKENENQKIVFDFWKQYYPQAPEKINLKTNFTERESKKLISFFFKSKILCLDLFPQTPLDFSSQKPKLIKQKADSCSFEILKSSKKTLSGLLIYSQKGQVKSSFFSSYKKEKWDLIWFILMAFLGGLILNVMPCVLPIIFLKFYNNLKIKDFSRKRQILLNGSYSIGVILSFLALALIIFISKKTGESLGWGFHLQSPYFVSFLALLFTIIGFYLLDIFSFSSPKLPKLFKDQKIFSHFLTGILSTTAASPCTVPFMAGAVGFAFSRSYLEIFSIFFFLGLGLSFPYLLLGIFPQILKYIPSPGKWSQTVKKLFSLPLFLTSLWLISILYVQLNLKSFLITLLIFPCLIVGIFLQKKISNPIGKKVCVLAFFFLILSILSLQTRFKSLQNMSLIKKESPFIDSNWSSFDENKILSDQKAGKNIFIAFGAKWCLTCKLNEKIFKKTEFQNLIDLYKIQLYYGDWTNKTNAITSFLEKHSKQGVPFYIFYQGEEKVFIFPTLLTQKKFLRNLENLAQ